MLSDTPWGALLGMIFTVVLVLCLAYWFTRYIVGGKHLSGFKLLQKPGSLQILAQLQLGKEQRIAVVQAGSRYFLLGMTAQSITMLTEFTEEEASAWIQKEETGSSVSTPPSAFQQTLEKTFKREKR